MRKEILSAGLFITGLVLLVVTSILVYREWGPSDNKALTGNTYYLSPNGNDSANGSAGSPWKTFTKANNTLKSGDTVILKDGVYPGYQKITVSGTTWKAENQHKAILDGGFSPADLQGTWDKFPEKYDSKCTVRFGEFPAWTNLLSVSGSSDVIVDGLFLRNSCGRGLLVKSAKSATSSNVTIKNNLIDFTFFAGMLGGKVDNLQIINNTFTRTSFNDQYSRKEGQNGRNYSVNAMNFALGKNGLFKGNTIAWSHGEISVGVGAQGAIVEDNTLVGVKNFMYSNNEQNTIVRNNLFYGLEEKHYPNTFLGSMGSRDGVDWRTVFRNEVGDNVPKGNRNKNIAFYNNIFFNVSLFMSGDHQGEVSNTENVYFAHNTFIAATGTRRLFDLTFSPKDGQNPFLSATFENNIFYKGKNPDTMIQASYDGGDKIIFRNNLWPTDVTNTVKGPGDIYTNDPGMVNPNLLATIKAPGISDATVDLAPINALRDNAFTNNLKLKAYSPAINAGNSNSTVVGDIPASILRLAKEGDFNGNQTSDVPDIGAFEYNGSDSVLFTQTPTPVVTNTPSPTPTTGVPVTITPTVTPTIGILSLTPTTPVTGNICGKADVDGDGRFNIADFAEFAKSYGMGTNICADKDVDYGPCGGRDVNKDGKLNIADFGGAGIGFAQRYYPKMSCAIN
jgi:hypothetical protein